MTEVSRDYGPTKCRDCFGRGGTLVMGGPGACERCGRHSDGRVEWWAFASGSINECDECGMVGGHDPTCSAYVAPHTRCAGRPVYRWADDPNGPPVAFATTADALAAAAFATDLPAGVDTLHLMPGPAGGVSIVASNVDGRPLWLAVR